MEIQSIISTSYTWKDEYLLPLESYWSRIAKFCFLNGFSWYNVQHNTELRKLISGSYFSDFYLFIPPFYLKESIKFDGYYYFFQSKYNAHKICPICMNYGYHSVLHEIEGLNYCVFHKCNLIKINSKDFYNSRFGTYEFWNVRVENIVKNGYISNEIMEFVRKQEKENFISSNCFFIDSKKNGRKNKCYESTERLYQNIVLLQDDIVLYGCKCISFMQCKDIEQINNDLFEHIIAYHIQSMKEKNFFYFKFRDDNEIRQFLITNYARKGKHGEFLLKDDLLGWCFITIATEAIKRNFYSLDDWNVTFNSLYDYTDMYLKIQGKVNKIAIILAVQALTGTMFPGVIQLPCSWNWAKGHKITNCNLPLYFEIGQIKETIPFLRGSPTEAGQYIVYPIIKDLFYDLVHRASTILKQNLNMVDKQFIRNLVNDLWIIPQYAVFYFKDRVEIYRCDPEPGE